MREKKDGKCNLHMIKRNGENLEDTNDNFKLGLNLEKPIILGVRFTVNHFL